MNWRVASRSVLEVVLFFLLLVGFWEAVVRISGLPTLLLPGPRDVARVLVTSWPSLFRHMLVTMQGIAWGFLLGAMGGFILGVLITYVGFARRVLYPLTSVAYVVPKSVFVPLFILWWGPGLTHKLLVIALLVFFPVMANLISGLRSADSDMVDLSRSLGGNKILTFRKIELPSSLPFVLAGLRIGVTEAFVGAIVVELIVPERGIGAQIVAARAYGNTQYILAAIAVIALFGIASYKGLERFERRITFWY